ncbi:MAG: Hpt domain-containing protein [Gammaproteobacteria bacterium]|nr:Hpt domain-containing protein [Gammaproteobacteria bacterium]
MRLYDVLEKYLDSASEPLLSSESQQTVVAEVVKRVDEGESGEESDDLSDMIDDEMWQDFWDYLKEAQQQLEQAWEAGDWEQIRSVAHAIKGMGSSYGEQEMTAVATHLQDHALSGKDASSPHYEKLLELLKRNDQ